MAATHSPVADWTAVRPGQTYDAATAAALFGCSVQTIIIRARKGQLRPMPRLTRKAPYNFLGAELLRQLGDQAAGLARPSETAAERDARAAAAMARIQKHAAKK